MIVNPPPGSAASHRAGLEPGFPAREAGALTRNAKGYSFQRQSARAPSLWGQERVTGTFKQGNIAIWHETLMEQWIGFSTQQNGMTNSFFFFIWRLSRFAKELLYVDPGNTYNSANQTCGTWSGKVHELGLELGMLEVQRRYMSNNISISFYTSYHIYVSHPLVKI